MREIKKERKKERKKSYSAGQSENKETKKQNLIPTPAHRMVSPSIGESLIPSPQRPTQKHEGPVRVAEQRRSGRGIPRGLFDEDATLLA